MNRRPWTDAEVVAVYTRFATCRTADLAAELGRTPRSVYAVAERLGLRKDPAVIRATRLRTLAEGRRSAGSRATQFKAGQKPWNTGRSYMPGGNNARGWFKPNRPAHEARNYVPVGSYRICAAGYLERKTTDDRRLAPVRRWSAVHRLVWQAAHGPVPPGHAVVFRPGRRSVELEQITLDALELVSRAELMRRNSVHRLPPEVAEPCRLRGTLRSRIKRMENRR